MKAILFCAKGRNIILIGFNLMTSYIQIDMFEEARKKRVILRF